MVQMYLLPVNVEYLLAKCIPFYTLIHRVFSNDNLDCCFYSL